MVTWGTVRPVRTRGHVRGASVSSCDPCVSVGGAQAGMCDVLARVGHQPPPSIARLPMVPCLATARSD